MAEVTVILKTDDERDGARVLDALRGLDFDDAALEQGGEEEDAFATLRFTDRSTDDAMNRAGELVREAARIAGVPEDRIGGVAGGID